MTSLITKRLKKSFIGERIGRILDFDKLGQERQGEQRLLTGGLLRPRDGCISFSGFSRRWQVTHG